MKNDLYAISKRNHNLCPMCRQDLRAEPHDGLRGVDCPQCGQGMRWRWAKKLKTMISAREKSEANNG